MERILLECTIPPGQSWDFSVILLQNVPQLLKAKTMSLTIQFIHSLSMYLLNAMC